MHNDDILDELHKVRDRLLREAGGSLADIGEWLRTREVEEKRKVVSLEPKKPKSDAGEAA